MSVLIGFCYQNYVNLTVFVFFYHIKRHFIFINSKQQQQSHDIIIVNEKCYNITARCCCFVINMVYVR